MIFRSTILSLAHKDEEVWPDGTHLCYSQSQVVSTCQSFRPVAPFFFWLKCHLWLSFIKYRKGCGHINILIPNIMGLWVELQPFKCESKILRQIDYSYSIV